MTVAHAILLWLILDELAVLFGIELAIYRGRA